MRGEAFDRLEYATQETVRFEPMPCWRDLPEKDLKVRVEELIREIESETAARHLREGTRPLGVKAILRQKPHDRPRRLKRGWAPAFHTATKAARRELVEAYGWFLAAYREAAEKLVQESKTASFPKGSFPRRFPFVGWVPESTPG